MNNRNPKLITYRFKIYQRIMKGINMRCQRQFKSRVKKINPKLKNSKK